MDENERATRDERESLVMHTVVSTILHGVLLVGLLAVLVVRVPKFHEIFKAFDTKLPPLTTSVLNIAVWCQNGLLVIPILGILLAGYAAVYYLARKHSRPMWHVLWSGLWYILVLLCYFAVQTAVELPLLDLMTSVGQKAGG
ncbi:MAG TPA: hypothetical protein VMY39_03600 [Planctomycetota bacterium]|nr:hypothetical protein [Planctomycetota bacterium]